MLLDHRTQWVTAAPLWQEMQTDPTKMQRPALLRFASDTFMEDLQAVLATLDTPQPLPLGGLIAKRESFRARPAGKAVDWTPPEPERLKLYQPAHGHFYLIAASLVCRAAGLPDRVVDVANGEKASFVLRRVQTDGTELGWINDPVNGKRWQPLPGGSEQTMLPLEELLPLFPVNFEQNDRRRRLFVGLVPTSSRDTFMAAPALSPVEFEIDPATKKPKDTRLDPIESPVFAALEALAQPSTGPEPTADVKAYLAKRQTEASLFILLDLAEYLATKLPTVWQALYDSNRAAAPSTSHGLYDLLSSWNVAGTTSWRAALRSVWDQRDRITGEATTATDLAFNLKHSDIGAARRSALRSALVTALGPWQPPTTQPAVSPVAVPKLATRPDVLYRLRCVYQRTHCPGLCPDELSAATEEFSIAPFFDFDAPSRPIRITMPVDTSIAGLRKFNKNVAFQISDQLRSQMNVITDLKKALDGNLASGAEFDLGVICSFSIPIITICALIVLMIFIFLLNIVFWWVPFFRICLPIRLKAKG